MGYSTERDSVYEMQAGGLLELLVVGTRRQATDPRDKVYAFLGVGRVVDGDGCLSPHRGPPSQAIEHGYNEGKEGDRQQSFSTRFIKTIDTDEIVPCVLVDYSFTVIPNLPAGSQGHGEQV